MIPEPTVTTVSGNGATWISTENTAKRSRLSDRPIYHFLTTRSKDHGNIALTVKPS